MAIKLAEDLERSPIEKADDKQKTSDTNLDKVDKDLTVNEVERIKQGKTSPEQLAAERMQAKAAAEAQLNQLVKDQIITDVDEYKAYLKELEATDSPEKTREIHQRIEKIPDEKKQKNQEEKDKNKELSPEDPKLLALEKKFNDICDKNIHLIGTGQISEFKDWIAKKRSEKPTVAYLENCIKRLEGNVVKDEGGLAPRREQYDDLQRLFKRHGISDPTDSKFIAREGLSERAAFLKNAENFEKMFDNKIDTFYDDKASKKIMEQILSADSLTTQEQTISDFKKLSEMESRALVEMEKTVNVGGYTIRAFSEKSKRMYLEGIGGSPGYRDITNFSERINKWMAHIEGVVNNEAKFAQQLVEIYKDDPEGLKLALGSFEELSYQEKEKEVAQHKKLKEESRDKEERDKKLVLKAVDAKVDNAQAKHFISPETAKKFKVWFENEENYRNPETRKPGDTETLKKYYAILVSPTPDGKAQNLAAYEIKRTRFKKEVKQLKDIDPSISEQDLDKWQQDYDKEGWTGRKSVYKKLIKEKILKQKQQAEKRALEQEAGLKKEEKETVLSSPEKAEAIQAAIALINDDQAAEALKVLMQYNEKNPDDKDIIFWMEVAIKRIKEFGSGKKMDQDMLKEIDKEVEKLVQEDEVLKGKIEEEQITHLAIHGARISEERHQKQKSAQERAHDESVSKLEEGSLEADLTEDFYAMAGEDYKLDEEGKGEEIKSIDFTDAYWEKGERSQFKEATREVQNQIDTKEGITDFTFKDRSGRQVSSIEAEAIQEKDIEAIEEELSERAVENVAEKMPEKTGDNVFDLAAKMAADRKARELMEQKTHEKLKAA